MQMGFVGQMKLTVYDMEKMIKIGKIEFRSKFSKFFKKKIQKNR